MKHFDLLSFLTISLICLLTLNCSTSSDWRTIDDPKWGFKLDVPATLHDKKFEGKNLWIHEDDQLRVIVDFGNVPSQAELNRKKNYRQTAIRINGYDAVIYTYTEQLNPAKKQFERVATLIFQESPASYGEGKPPAFRVEYISEKDLETAMQILQTVRFYGS